MDLLAPFSFQLKNFLESMRYLILESVYGFIYLHEMSCLFTNNLTNKLKFVSCRDGKYHSSNTSTKLQCWIGLTPRRPFPSLDLPILQGVSRKPWKCWKVVLDSLINLLARQSSSWLVDMLMIKSRRRQRYNFVLIFFQESYNQITVQQHVTEALFKKSSR